LGKGGSTPYKRASWNFFKLLRYLNMLTNVHTDKNLPVLKVQGKLHFLKNFSGVGGFSENHTALLLKNKA